MTIEELKNARAKAGENVVDLSGKLNAALVDEKISEDELKGIKASLDTARAKRDMLADEIVTLEAEQVKGAKKQPLNENEKDLKASFVKEFKAMIKGDPKVVASLNSDTDESGNAIGLTIPSDVQTAINELVRQFDTLQEYVNVEKVSTNNGSRNIEVLSGITPLKNLDAEDGEIPDNDDPKLRLIKYLIKRYAGINTVTNSLLKDTAENILAWLSKWIGKKVAVTRNAAIIAAVNAVPEAQKVTVADLDGIKDVTNVKLDPAFAGTTMFITNQNGYNVLDKVKRSDGSYLIQKDVTSATGYLLFGKPIKRISNKFLPDIKVDETNSAYPLWIGDLKEAVTLFDREQMSLLTTNIGGGAFETDTTKVRVIDRFDVQLNDPEAVVVASFSAIADEAVVAPKA